MKLSEYLSENGISQKFLASKLHYSLQYVNSIVKSRRKPSKLFIKAFNAYVLSHQQASTKLPDLEWDSSKREDK